MKAIIPYLCLISGLFPVRSSSLPIPGKHYILSDIETLVPATTGIAVAEGITLGARLGPEGTILGAVIGALGGATAGVLAGASFGIVDKGVSNNDQVALKCLRELELMTTWCSDIAQDARCDERPRISFTLKASAAAGFAGLAADSLLAVPIAAGTTTAVEAGIRKLDPYAGVCSRPDSD